MRGWYKVLLPVVGCLLGVIPCVIGYYLLAPRGSSFNSLSDLKHQMLERGTEDKKGDGSVSLRSIIEPDESDTIIYRLRPNLETLFQHVPIRTNKCGMRGPEVTLNKPADTYRIALLGDSFAFGWGVIEEQSFARLIEQNLQSLVKDKKKIEVLNFGVPGYSTFQEAAAFLENGLDFSPDLVLVYFVENDFGLPFFIQSENGLSNALDFVKKAWKGNDTEASEEHKRLVSLSDPNKSLAALGAKLRELGIPLILTINPGKSYESDKRRLPVLKRKDLIRFLPLRKEVLQEIEDRKLEPKELSLPDDPHPSPIKHEILGRLIAKGIASMWPLTAQDS